MSQELQQQVNELKSELAELRCMVGNMPVRLASSAGGGPLIFVARVYAASRDSTNFRWAYQIVEMVKSTAGHGGWADKSGGRTGVAYSMLEAYNGASGLMGTGVNTGNLIGTFSHQPIPEDVPILVLVATLDDGTKEYQIPNLSNGVDGACPII